MEFSKVFLVALLPLLFIPAYAQEAQPENQLPPWVKGIFNFWVDGGIADSELISAIEFLIDDGIIELNEIQIDRNVRGKLFYGQYKFSRIFKFSKWGVDSVEKEKKGLIFN